MRHNKNYLEYIRTKPCLFCAAPAEPHHIRSISIVPYKFRGGTGLKPSDYMSIPLCRKCHDIVHNSANGVELSHYMIIEQLVEYIEESKNGIT